MIEGIASGRPVLRPLFALHESHHSGSMVHMSPHLPEFQGILLLSTFEPLDRAPSDSPSRKPLRFHPHIRSTMPVPRSVSAGAGGERRRSVGEADKAEQRLVRGRLASERWQPRDASGCALA
jgi:hypothetical protein